MPVILFLQGHLAEYSFSRRKIKSFIDSGLCSINNRVARKCQVPVLSKQVVTLILPQQQSRPSFSPARVLYEDENFFAYDKPAGVAFEEAVPSQRFLPVHRLDKDTSGVLLFAKQERAHALLLELFRERKIQKKYLAIVDGAMKLPSGTIEKRLAPQQRLQGRVLWGVASRHGSYARSDWRVLQRRKDATLVELVPHTGKTHQLRVHMQSIGHPILGDTQYSTTFGCSYGAVRQLLHAQELLFQCPLSCQQIKIVAPLPEDMENAITALF